jgi:hypothetical protein
VTTTEHASTDLLQNLVTHLREPEVPLLVPLATTRAFMQVVEAVRSAPEPVELRAAHRALDRSGPHPRHVVPGVADAVVRAADELALLSELNLPWAQPAKAAARG